MNVENMAEHRADDFILTAALPTEFKLKFSDTSLYNFLISISAVATVLNSSVT